MSKGEQVENLKFWVKILFEWPQSLFAATEICILIFNLTHSLISLMGSFHFPQWKIFLPIHWQILKILGNGISRSFILSLKCDRPLFCEFPILFSTVAPKLGHKRWEIGTFEKPRLHFQIFQFTEKLENWDFCPLAFIFG